MLGHRAFVPLCLLAALVIRLGWAALLINVQPVSDMRWYVERGADLVAGYGYTVRADSFWPEYMIPPYAGDWPAERRPTAYWPVGYPAFLAVLFRLAGPSPGVISLSNVALAGITLWLVYRLGALLFSELAGRTALLLLAFYPNYLAYTSLAASETLFVCLTLLGAWLLLARPRPLRSAILAGAVFGLAALVRLQALFLPAVLLLAARFDHRPAPTGSLLARMALLYASLALVILPWVARNSTVFHQFVFISTNGGVNLLIGNNPTATGGYGLTEELIAVLDHARTEPERDRAATELALDYVLGHPLQTVALWPAKLWYLFGKDFRGIFWNEQGLQPGPAGRTLFTGLKILSQFYYLLVLAAAVWASGQAVRRRDRSFSVAGWGVIFYFTAIHLLTFGESRYHLPMMPWLMMMAGHWLAVRLSIPTQETTRVCAD